MTNNTHLIRGVSTKLGHNPTILTLVLKHYFTEYEIFRQDKLLLVRIFIMCSDYPKHCMF